ncbi:hypothetical protein Tco_1200895 [Tanacetum coccineum]
MGRKAVLLPAEIGMPTIANAEVNIPKQSTTRADVLDWNIRGRLRNKQLVRENAWLQMKGYYDAKVRGVSFRPGDFVYRAKRDAKPIAEDNRISWDSGRDPTRLRSKLEMEHSSCVSWWGELPRTWEYLQISKNAIFRGVLIVVGICTNTEYYCLAFTTLLPLASLWRVALLSSSESPSQVQRIKDVTLESGNDRNLQLRHRPAEKVISLGLRPSVGIA